MQPPWNMTDYRLVFNNGDLEYTAYISLLDSPAGLPDHSFLTIYEKERLGRLSLTRANEFIISRYLAKRAVCNVNRIEALKNVEIRTGVFGHPVLTMPAGNKHNNLSISHSDYSFAVIVFEEEHPVAIDIESICPDKVKGLAYNLTEDETYLSKNCPILLTVLWTAKEALSKVLKCGLTVPYKILEVENIETFENYFSGQYVSFSQYQFISFFYQNNICSIVFPKKSKLAFNILIITN